MPLSLSHARRCRRTARIPTRAHALSALLCVIALAWSGMASELMEIEVDGTIRTAWVHIPESTDSDALIPVVMAFHGSTWNGRTMEQVTGFSDIADREGFVVVYPNGTGPADILSWNAIYCCSFALEQQVDDFQFVDELTAALLERYPIDANRIYATGFSNGAMFVYALAIARPHQFAAVAPVAGAMYASQQQPRVPMPMMIIHGTNDVVLPYDGGWGALGSWSGRTEPAIPVLDAADFWLDNNGCSHDSTVVLTERNARIETYVTCGENAEVTVITLIDGEHAWPTIVSNASGFLLTEDAADLLESLTVRTLSDVIPWDLFETGIDASEQIWTFFSRHQR